MYDPSNVNFMFFYMDTTSIPISTQKNTQVEEIHVFENLNMLKHFVSNFSKLKDF